MIADRIHCPSLKLDALMVDGRDVQVGDELLFLDGGHTITGFDPAPASTTATFGPGIRVAHTTAGDMAVWDRMPVHIVATPAALARVTSPLQPAHAA